jgi:hypothetical protein
MKYLSKHFRYIAYGGLIFLVSCTSKEDLTGLYVGSFQSNIDSLKIHSKGTYERVIYDNNKRKIFSNKSSYQVEDGYITFDEFLLNENDLSSSTKYDSDDLLMASLPYTWTFSGITIISNDDLAYFYFKK